MVSRQSPLHQSRHNQLRQRNTRLFIFLLIGFCLFFFMRYTSRLFEYSQEKLAVARWEQKIADAKLDQAELLAHRDYVQTDAYVEEVSRRELLMARPEDTLLVVLPDESAATGDGAAILGINGEVINSGAINNEAIINAEAGNLVGSGNAGATVNTTTPSNTGAVVDPSLASNGQTAGAPLALPTAADPALQSEPVWRQWIRLFSQAPN